MSPQYGSGLLVKRIGKAKLEICVKCEHWTQRLNVKCRCCKAAHLKPFTRTDDCTHCNGTATCTCCDGKPPCVACKGTGKCPHCSGTGKIL